MRVVILAGGKGTRMQAGANRAPKPLVEIGGRPILWHVMEVYSRFGFGEFIVALGYQADILKQYFLTQHRQRYAVKAGLRNSEVRLPAPVPHQEDWIAHLVDTGENTETGGRLRQLAPWIAGERFLMTYADGLGNVDIANALQFHANHGRLATVTAVRPVPRFGCLRLKHDRVTAFREKSRADAGWINGGFFVLEPDVLDYITGDHVVFERDPLERLAAEGQLMAYRHRGFWRCMDTLKDQQELETFVANGRPPWTTPRQVVYAQQA